MAAERIDHEIGRRLEHARLGAAKAIEALLRVADDEEARWLLPARAAAGPRVRREPGMQRMPLQRARVLELVDQQVAHAQVELLLHPAGEVAVAQRRQRQPFEIGHVGEAVTPLVVGVRGEQRADEPDHALVLEVGVVLGDLLVQPRQELAGLGQRRRLGQVLAHRARLG